MRRSLALIVLVLLAVVGAHATTIPEMTPAELVARSDLVAKVTVKSHTTEWVGRRILTFYALDVAEVWRAKAPKPPAKTVLALPGGEIGDIGQKVAGTPVLVDGATYVLCLSEAVGPKDARALVGLWQGAWRVDAAGRLLGFTHAGPDTVPLVMDDVRARFLAP